MVGADHVEHPVAAGDRGLGRDPLSRPRRGDRPAQLDLVDGVDHLDDRTDVPEELARRPILDPEQPEAVSLVALLRAGDPIPSLLEAERVGIEAHVFRIGLDAVQCFRVTGNERAQTEPFGLEDRRGDLHARIVADRAAERGMKSMEPRRSGYT